MTDEEIEAAARQLHTDRSKEAARYHSQLMTPWGDLGETLKESYRQIARDQQAEEATK